MTSMKDLYYRLKWAFQRAYRGYDDEAIWDFDDYLVKGIPALKKLCSKDVYDDKEGHNKKRIAIFTYTLELIHDYETSEWYQQDEALHRLYAYVSEHLLWYWD